MCTPSRPAAAVAALLLSLAVASGAAPPDVPGQVSYQGVLLDDLGQPRTGTVDLTLRIHDAITGGALLYVETIPSVPLTEGIFAVALGPTGDATDPPGPDPATTSLVTALSGDVPASGPDRFLEVTVGSEDALSRTQILATPFALRAETAAQADVATTALEAGDASSVGGLSSSFVTEVYAHTNLDGTGPGNAHADEGLGDVDGNGVANFVDPDNDGDGIDDGTEIDQGSSINLVTPVVTGFSPPSADGFITSTVTVQGENFEPGIGVVFGSQTPTPTNVTPTSFDVLVGPQAEGPTTVTVTRTNLESDTEPFSFFFLQPVIDSVSPAVGLATETTHVFVTGQNFDPGMTVDFGSESPTPQNVTPTEFAVDVGPQSLGFVDVTVTHPNGKFATLVDAFEFSQDLVPNVHGLTTDDDTRFTIGVHGVVGVLGAKNAYEFSGAWRSFPTAGGDDALPGQLAMTLDPTGRVAGLRCFDTGSGCDVRVERDTGSDGITDTTAVIEAATKIISPSLAFDSAGAPVAGYIALPGVGTFAKVAHDRDDDGAFTGTNEVVQVDSLSGIATNLGDVMVDGSDNVAFVYFDTSGKHVRVAWDRSGDGDFDDAPGGMPELSTLATLGGDPVCLGAGFAADGDLAVAWDDGTSLQLARDLDGDADFTDPGETVTLDTGGGAGCDVSGEAGFDLAVGHVTAGGVVRLRVDRNDDGDFDDTDETLDLDTLTGVNQVALDHSEIGLVFMATGGSGAGARKIYTDQVGP